MKLMVDQRSTKVAPKVQRWYAFWYACSAHTICTPQDYFNVWGLSQANAFQGRCIQDIVLDSSSSISAFNNDFDLLDTAASVRSSPRGDQLPQAAV